MKAKYKKLKSTKIYSGHTLDFYKDDILINNKIKSAREYVNFPNAVGIIPILPDNKIVLVRQYRYTNGIYSLEIPAGKKDKKGTFLQTAKRELLEETGYTAKKFTKILRSIVEIIEVDPEQENLKQEEAVSILAKELKKAEYKCCILTLEKNLYKEIEDKEYIKFASPQKIFTIISLLYSILPEDIKSLYDAWFDNED